MTDTTFRQLEHIVYTQYTNRLQSQMEIQDGTPNTGRYTKYWTVHQIRDSTPNTGQYTKYGTVHQKRDSTPNTGQYTKNGTVYKIRDSTSNESPSRKFYM